MPNKTKIFICAHKDFEVPDGLSNELYSIITNGIDLGDKSPYETIIVPESYKNDLSGNNDREYSEMYMIRYLYEHQDLISDLDYIGFCHYRRYFEFLNNPPKLSAEGSNDCILAKPMTVTPYGQYYACHAIEDLDIFIGIIKQVDKSIADEFMKYLNGNRLYICNMFVISKDMFNQMMSILVKIIDLFVSKVGNIQEHINKHKERYKHCINNDTERYQRRLIAYLAERFTGFYASRFSRNPFITESLFIKQ